MIWTAFGKAVSKGLTAFGNLHVLFASPVCVRPTGLLEKWGQQADPC